MIVPPAFASHFARTVALFRDPQAKDAQKMLFRALLALLKTDAVTLRANGGEVLVNGTAVAGTVCAPLPQRLDLHGVAEIVIPQDPPPAELFELLKVLADPPSEEDTSARLRRAGTQRITVATLASPEPQTTQAAAPDPVATDAAPRTEAPKEPAARGDLLAQLERSTDAQNVADLLGGLTQEIEAALDGGRIEEALRIAAGIVRREERTRDATARRPYSIALKRLYSKRLLEALARLVQIPAHEADAVAVIQRSGAPGVEVLLDLLVASPTVGERQGVFNALTKMKEGTEQLVHLLSHSQWFVVRNVAELVGELGLEDAVPALARQLEHEDLRVRKAVALALAKIGSRGAAEPLRRALRDKSPEVRMQAALGVGGRKSGALAMPLVVAMEGEKDEAVEREMILALGRIASADAVQALIKCAQPPGKLFRRKSTELRLAAVEGLRLAATPAAVGTLQGLTGDADKEVRGAAQDALQELRAARASAKPG